MARKGGNKKGGNLKLKVAINGAKKAQQELDSLQAAFNKLEQESSEMSKSATADMEKMAKQIAKLEKQKKEQNDYAKKQHATTRRMAKTSMDSMVHIAKGMKNMQKATRTSKQDTTALLKVMIEMRDELRGNSVALRQLGKDASEGADGTYELKEATEETNTALREQLNLQKRIHDETVKRSGGGNRPPPRDGSRSTERFGRGGGSSARALSKMGRAAGGLTATYAVIAANVFAMQQSFDQLAQGESLNRLRENLSSIGGYAQPITATAQAMQELTGYTLSTENALRQAARATAYGFNTEQIERMTVAARKASVALGINMTDALDRLVRGIQKQEVEVLDELGIVTRLIPAMQRYAEEHGKTVAQLTDLERRQALYNESMRQAEKQYGEVSTAAGVLEESGARLATIWEELRATIAAAAGEFLHFTGLLDNLKVASMDRQIAALQESIARNEAVLASGEGSEAAKGVNQASIITEQEALNRLYRERASLLGEVREAKATRSDEIMEENDQYRQQANTLREILEARKNYPESMSDVPTAPSALPTSDVPTVVPQTYLEMLGDLESRFGAVNNRMAELNSMGALPQLFNPGEYEELAKEWDILNNAINAAKYSESLSNAELEEAIAAIEEKRAAALTAGRAEIDAMGATQVAVDEARTAWEAYGVSYRSLQNQINQEGLRFGVDDFLSEVETTLKTVDNMNNNFTDLLSGVQEAALEGLDPKAAYAEIGELLDSSYAQLVGGLTDASKNAKGLVGENGIITPLLGDGDATEAQIREALKKYENLRDEMASTARDIRLFPEVQALQEQRNEMEQFYTANREQTGVGSFSTDADASYQTESLSVQQEILSNNAKILNLRNQQNFSSDTALQLQVQELELANELNAAKQKGFDMIELNRQKDASYGIGAGAEPMALLQNESLGGAIRANDKGDTQAFNAMMSEQVNASMSAIQSIEPVMGQMTQGMYDFGQTTLTMFQAASDGGLSFADTMAGVSAGIQAVSGIAQASSQMAVQDIDYQIAMEKKRDGKSAESQKKIAALEKKKIKEQQKAKLQQAVMSTAAGIAEALTLPWPMNLAMAAIVGGMGMKQIQAIKQKGAQDLALASMDGGGQDMSLSVGKLDRSVDVGSNATGSELDNLRGFKPGRAAGGVIMPGSGYMVGENGPEMITPKVPMEVTPSDANTPSVGGGLNITISPTISTIDSASFEDRIDQVSESLIGSLEKELNNRGLSLNDLRV